VPVSEAANRGSRPIIQGEEHTISNLLLYLLKLHWNVSKMCPNFPAINTSRIRCPKAVSCKNQYWAHLLSNRDGGTVGQNLCMCTTSKRGAQKLHLSNECDIRSSPRSKRVWVSNIPQPTVISSSLPVSQPRNVERRTRPLSVIHYDFGNFSALNPATELSS
jgi:hypothetical protein